MKNYKESELPQLVLLIYYGALQGELLLQLFLLTYQGALQVK